MSSIDSMFRYHMEERERPWGVILALAEAIRKAQVDQGYGEFRMIKQWIWDHWHGYRHTVAMDRILDNWCSWSLTVGRCGGG